MMQLFSSRVRGFRASRVVCAGLLAGLMTAGAHAQDAEYSTDEMLEDDHFREEFGINDFTTPSIKLIFDDLGNLGPIPYGDLKRDARDKVSRDRVAVALNLGTLIADGFLIVQAERLKDIEPVGKAILKHAEALGTGRHIKRHSRSLLEYSALGQTDKLRTELESTQRDVEKEMVDLRDVDIAHLISLGGWARAFEIGCAVINKDFSSDKVRMIARADITSYFQAQLETLHPKIQERELVKQVNEALVQLHAMIDMPEEREFTKADLAAMSAKAKEVSDLITNAR
ncbi:hypothetical protein [Sulfuriroseicoccus oceanibius]|uniref:Uncharacterized protein n=1 Tax=Sulfuriroseicoccus oceanibius TaxID=2707525 RepID=A0A6B3LFG4_9BACT|nr:hypothetical protein [Sulfuriroseicoccus oceanibius]QQL45722.1 hypothetical protein G3M56_003805 [Sulfuriroseicoccus oceanibius]